MTLFPCLSSATCHWNTFALAASWKKLCDVVGHEFALADWTLDKEQLDLKTRMEEPALVEGQNQLPSPHHSSLRKAMAAALVLDGESTMGRRKKKKKESRPESIIIYRSESETLDEEPGESEGGDQPKEEEGDDFIDYPMDDGESLWGHLLKATGSRPSEDPVEARQAFSH